MFDYMAWVPKTYCGQVAGMAWKIGNLAAKAATGANIAKLIADKIREYVDLNGASTTRSCMPQLVISPCLLQVLSLRSILCTSKPDLSVSPQKPAI